MYHNKAHTKTNHRCKNWKETSFRETPLEKRAYGKNYSSFNPTHGLKIRVIKYIIKPVRLMLYV
jgi:hypothetical protein